MNLPDRDPRDDGFVSIGYLVEPVTFQPLDDDPTVGSGLLVIPATLSFTLTGSAACALEYAITGMPWFYRPRHLALPVGESVVRLALPWGDSAYTSAVYERHPVEWWPVPTWCMGPIENGLTPSSEGPRRRDEAEDRVFARMADRVQSRWLGRLFASWGDIEPTSDVKVGDRDGWDDVSYAGPMSLLRGDRVGWTDRHGVIHTGVITDRRDTARGTELDITPDEEGCEGMSDTTAEAPQPTDPDYVLTKAACGHMVPGYMMYANGRAECYRCHERYRCKESRTP